jgi:hypothetical protein
MVWGLPLLALLVGCGGGDGGPSSNPSAGAPESAASNATPSSEATAPAASPGTPAEQAAPFAPIRLGEDSAPAEQPQDAGTTASSAADPDAQREAILDAMMPLQVMLGTWRGIPQRAGGAMREIDQPRWVWDFQTDRSQPAMVMTSTESPYFRSVRLTYLTDRGVFQLTAEDTDGQTRRFEGKFAEPPEEYQGDDKKLHRRYKLELNEVDPADAKDQWQVVFNHQENNRYLLELARKRAGRFQRFETVATQREGTSFALSEDYGEKECIISGGLGVMQVSHEGKSYWVCCSGCKAAFEEDPATWIAEYEAKQKESQ